VIFFRMGTNPKGCFLSGMARRNLVFFQVKKVEFFSFYEELFFW
jgi:hypothetical protein